MNEGESGDFVPHITLGRVDHLSEPEKSRVQRHVREWSALEVAWTVSDVRLKASVDGDDGRVYRDLEVCAL